MAIFKFDFTSVEHGTINIEADNEDDAYDFIGRLNDQGDLDDFIGDQCHDLEFLKCSGRDDFEAPDFSVRDYYE